MESIVKEKLEWRRKNFNCRRKIRITLELIGIVAVTLSIVLKLSLH
jgi:hypothetical protein